ncbi:MAG TPA: mechanosensitive ion channel domain-containing protein [Candidatus Limnocylindrales bacterium]|nr:mechanosensitive ion channel domain-containing protein [Candidatus Limnocylindrales bacterium]
MIPAATSGSGISLYDPTVNELVLIVVGLVVLVAFIVASRLIARFAGDQLHKRQVRADVVVLGRRVVTFVVIVLGLFLALGFALQNANLPLFGLLLATVVAAFGVQDLLRDYVSGYYVLLERHFRVGDRITLEGVGSGVIQEVRLRVTLLKSDAGDLLVIPNSELFNKSVTVHVSATERAQETKSAPPQ